MNKNLRKITNTPGKDLPGSSMANGHEQTTSNSRGARLPRAVMAGGLITCMGVTGLFGLAAAPAHAAESLPVENNIYSIDADGQIVRFDIGTGAVSNVVRVDGYPHEAYSTNGLAMSEDGTKIMSFSRLNDSANTVTSIDIYDVTTETWSKVNNFQPTVFADAGIDGAYDSATGIYYFGSRSEMRAFDTKTMTLLPGTQTLNGLPTEGATNGDSALDGLGNMFTVRADTVFVADISNVDWNANGTINYVVAGTSTGNNAGIAFNQTDGYLYTGHTSSAQPSATTLSKVDPTTGQIAGSFTIPNHMSTDLTSGNSPSSVYVVKNLSSRYAPDDQFQLDLEIISKDGSTVENSGSVITEGSDTGRVAGSSPLLALPEKIVRVKETAVTGDILNYRTSYQCVDLKTQALVVEGEGTELQFDFPLSQDRRGTSIECVVTNSAITDPPVDPDANVNASASAAANAQPDASAAAQAAASPDA
ncbi:hypothetical protein, partial [Glutamicibacter protophormiae]|uniref:hypothetical protein n=1 Tax=Glutamicibacter protophormiae TaxID=37930 RepID=UPI003326EC5B